MGWGKYLGLGVDEAERGFEKLFKKLKVEELLGGLIGGELLSGPDAIEGSEPDPLPIPDPPIGYGTAGEGARSKKKFKSGRGGSILAGALTPKNIGKQILG